MAIIRLLHGSNHIIRKPQLFLGKEHNDYGRGFYCTEMPEMAKEWACKGNTDGFVNEYILDADTLNILNLLDGHHTILNWMALLLKNRIFDLQEEIAIDARNYIIEHFSLNLNGYDVVMGYRADDSYFSYAQAFVSNALPLRRLNQALKLVKLGVQTALISENAFRHLEFVHSEPVNRQEYYPRFIARDIEARMTYQKEIKKNRPYKEDVFVMDILREDMKNEDPRIQSIISE